MQYLAFLLDGEKYALNILNVKEIVSYADLKVRPLSNSPVYMKGFARWHNDLLPVIDLHSLYQTSFQKEVSKLEINEFTVVIIIKTKNQLAGVIVDAVIEIITLESEQIKTASSYETLMQQVGVENIGITDQGIFIILNPEKILFQYGILMDNTDENG